jgi:hypothetical protein
MQPARVLGRIQVDLADKVEPSLVLSFDLFMKELHTKLLNVELRRRNGGHPPPLAQSRTCGFPASGSSVVLACAQGTPLMQTPSGARPPSSRAVPGPPASARG